MNTKTKKLLTHVALAIVMLLASCIYFMPVLEGKALPQGDTQKFEAMAHESHVYHQETGDYAHWNNSMFGGMPNCQIGGGKPSASLFTKIKCALDGEYIGWIFLKFCPYHHKGKNDVNQQILDELAKSESKTPVTK